MNSVKPATFAQIESIWYEGYRENRDQHYHSSRYHFLNLHSFFHALWLAMMLTKLWMLLGVWLAPSRWI